MILLLVAFSQPFSMGATTVAHLIGFKRIA